jgi:hypothetical protein
MTPDIIRKLTEQLDAAITTEVQVVYLLAGIRKLIERDNLRDQFRTLNFHCDWGLHSKLDRTHAQEVLRRFDDAHPFLRANMELGDLPPAIGSEITNISTMRGFRRELERFFSRYKLPSLTQYRSDGWVYFLQFYTQVIADIPLLVKAAAKDTKHISQVTVQFKRADQLTETGERFFKVCWIIEDNSGKSGELYVINSYTEYVSS